MIMIDNCITTTVGKIFSFNDRQRIVNIGNFFGQQNASVAGQGRSVCPSGTLVDCAQIRRDINVGSPPHDSPILHLSNALIAASPLATVHW